MLKRLYDWMMEKAAHAHAERWLFLFSFVESSFFPIPPHPLLGLMCLAGVGTLFICGGIQGYQAFVGDLRRTGMLEWPLRILLVVGGFVLATPGGGINPLSQFQVTSLGLAILIPTVAVAMLLMRGQPPVTHRLRAR